MQLLIARTLGEHHGNTSVTPLPGLTGQSLEIQSAQGKLVARPAPQRPIPFVNRQREFRILRKLHRGGLVPAPLAGDQQGIILPWQEGEVLTPDEFTRRMPEVITLLRQLHQQPLTGYRLRMLPLLWQYWQICRQRNLAWLRALQRLSRLAEPRPLRLAPLHMDVHAGNIVSAKGELHLIDWEYAADGDVALELAAVCAVDPQQQQQWLIGYAQATQLPLWQLARQAAYWQPWLRLLMASWYQLRAEQSGEKTLLTLAQQSWKQI